MRFCATMNLTPLLAALKRLPKYASGAMTGRRRDPLVCRQSRRGQGARTVERDRRFRNRFDILLCCFSLFSRQWSAREGDRIEFSAKRFEGVFTSPVSAEAFDNTGAADAKVNRVHTRDMGYSSRRRVAGRSRVATSVNRLHYTIHVYSFQS